MGKGADLRQRDQVSEQTAKDFEGRTNPHPSCRKIFG
jgi:hypothetical protein